MDDKNEKIGARPKAYFYIDRSRERAHRAAFPALRFLPPDPVRHSGPVVALYERQEPMPLTAVGDLVAALSARGGWTDEIALVRAVEAWHGIE